MLIPIKIECACGQRYAFDVEPVNGRLPNPVACPVCGVDGTEAANTVIAQSGVPAVNSASNGRTLHIAAGSPDRVATAPTKAHRPQTGIGRVDRKQAEHEARARISWGDSDADVTRYLMLQGFDRQEAAGLIQGMLDERAATIRRNGIQKTVIGAGLVCVPAITIVVFLSVGYFPLKLIGATLVVGAWGAWMILKGTIMAISPGSEPGDVAEQ